MPCEEGFLEGEGLEKTWMIRQEDILKEVDINSSRKPFDMILPGKMIVLTTCSNKGNWH